MAAKFGPAGNSQSFKDQGYKATIQAPGYVEKMGLDCYEYQCGHGVRISPEAAAAFGKKAVEHGISLSLHAPYYISLSSTEEEKRRNSVGYIADTARAARIMGGDRIVVHTGSCGKISREEALSLAGDTLSLALAELDRLGLSDITVCPETMGKVNQLGTLSEVLALCAADERLLPCVDFGHLNARTFGSIRSQADYAALLDQMENALGRDRASRFHAHFSKIAYTLKGGEKAHLTFADTLYGPDFEPLMEEIARRDWSPRFICESAGTQAEDARSMAEHYRDARTRKE